VLAFIHQRSSRRRWYRSTFMAPTHAGPRDGLQSRKARQAGIDGIFSSRCAPDARRNGTRRNTQFEYWTSVGRPGSRRLEGEGQLGARELLWRNLGGGVWVAS
jgi:hypothetical protein